MLKWLIGIIVEKVLKFAWDKLSKAIRRDKEQKETNQKIDSDEAAKAEKLKQAQTDKEIEDAVKDSLSNL